jgi:hypothetical protein
MVNQFRDCTLQESWAHSGAGCITAGETTRNALFSAPQRRRSPLGENPARMTEAKVCQAKIAPIKPDNWISESKIDMQLVNCRETP